MLTLLAVSACGQWDGTTCVGRQCEGIFHPPTIAADAFPNNGQG